MLLRPAHGVLPACHGSSPRQPNLRPSARPPPSRHPPYSPRGRHSGGARHNKGCNCKKSGCLKKYLRVLPSRQAVAERPLQQGGGAGRLSGGRRRWRSPLRPSRLPSVRFLVPASPPSPAPVIFLPRAGIACSDNCKCLDCKNYEGSEAREALLSPQQVRVASLHASGGARGGPGVRWQGTDEAQEVAAVGSCRRHRRCTYLYVSLPSCPCSTTAATRAPLLPTPHAPAQLAERPPSPMGLAPNLPRAAWRRGRLAALPRWRRPALVRRGRRRRCRWSALQQQPRQLTEEQKQQVAREAMREVGGGGGHLTQAGNG